MLIHCPISRQAQRNPSYPVIIENGSIISYKMLNLKTENYKNFLQKISIKRNSRVAIFTHNSSDTIAVLFALWRLKAVACVLNTRNPVSVIQNQLQEIKAELLITDNINLLNSKKIRIPKVNLKNLLSFTHILSFTTYHYQLDQPATIMFTSGSTSKPKAALHSLGNHYFSALGSNEHIKLKKHDRWLLSLPLYHVSGLGILWRSFLAGSAVVISNSNENLSNLIKKYSITHVSLVTTQLQTLLQSRYNLPSLKAILVGGSAINDQLVRKTIDKKLPIYISYGLTEMTSQVATSNKITEKSLKPKTKLLKYRQLRVSFEGEILVKGKTLFLGYVSNKKLTKPFDRQGWFHTGDLGYLKKGSLKVAGRKDNMFISGGENIQPEEIERHLLNIKGIESAAVVPVADKKFGFRPAAVIKFRPSFKIAASKIEHLLKINLAKYKIPIKYYSWPKNFTMDPKINRKELQKALRLF